VNLRHWGHRWAGLTYPRNLQHGELEERWGQLMEKLDRGSRLCQGASQGRHVQKEEAKETCDQD
jgi:hypothetical protein